MSGILIPISLFTKVFSYGLPGTVAEFPFIAFLILVLFQASQRTDALITPHIPRNVVFYGLGLLILQFIAIARSYGIYGDSVQGIGVITSFADIIGLIATFILSYYVIALTVDSEKSVLDFAKSIILTLIFFEVLVLIPQIIASLTPHFHGWVNLLAELFEKRWHGRNFYLSGSYAVTMRRINGFEAEAGYLAGQIGLVFLPLIIAGLAQHFSFFNPKTASSQKQYRRLLVLFVTTLMILFFAKTTTGFLVIGLSIVLLFWKADQADRQLLGLLGVFAVILVIVAFIAVPTVRHLLNQYLFQKSGTDNRLGGTIALVKTFVQHPFIGVGNGWAGPYLVQNAPNWSKTNWEFIYVYAVSGYPVLSIWGGWLAQFGIVLVAGPIWYIYRQLKNIIGFKKSIQAKEVLSETESLYVVIANAFEIFLIMFVFLAFLIFSWSEYYVLLSFFFYVLGLRVLQRKIIDLD